jgi:DNA-binding MarR family transcriptional regulator
MEANRDDVRDLNGVTWRMVNAFQRGFAKVVDPARLNVLRLVADRGDLRPTEIAAELEALPSSVTRHVQALEELGFVATVANPADARSSLVTVTDAGRAELNRFDETGVDATLAVLEDWQAEDVRQLTTLLSRLVDSWEQHGATARRPARWTRRNPKGPLS